eukprot:10678264-Alexandrium_andersonii.AAC.1
MAEQKGVVRTEFVRAGEASNCLGLFAPEDCHALALRAAAVFESTRGLTDPSKHPPAPGVLVNPPTLAFGSSLPLSPRLASLSAPPASSSEKRTCFPADPDLATLALRSLCQGRSAS